MGIVFIVYSYVFRLEEGKAEGKMMQAEQDTGTGFLVCLFLFLLVVENVMQGKYGFLLRGF